MPDQKLNTRLKLLIIASSITVTIGFHYGLIWESLFGHIHWLHALHGRFCYIPIVIASSWFGLRGGLYSAALISVLVLPYVLAKELGTHSLAGEIVEIVFYFAIAIVTGSLVERELKIRKKHEQTNLQLEKSHRLSMVGQIAAGVAHEIKNPLASIKGSVEILTDDKTKKSDKEEFKNIVLSEIKRIDATVTNFLELSRSKNYNFEKIEFSSIVKTCLKQINVHASKTNIVIEENLKPDIYINGDKEKVHQVLLNLLLNAIQASQDQSKIIVNLSDSKSKALLQVIDYGEGIPEETIDKIFDPFFTTKPSGSGLGLALVKNIIEKHNATIEFESTPNEGTTVTVTFPIYGALK